ncbi:hypothetical protein GIB67_035816 [Kingdonia uniflora]|uniref:Uncharacterized protein n=1 Tax=Kingdonia uniflora TaxID=39325 RepID=A0A7J7MJI8_9MAGN|nr:hypothetical protein GIB67_035816 [Kingdonia uniflora]
MLEDQLVEITEQPSIGICELKKALSSLLQLGKGPLAQQLLLKAYGSRLLKKIDGFLPSCSIYEETYSWAEWEIESFIRLVEENAPSSEMIIALRAASICVQASFNHCSKLESLGLKVSKLFMVLLQPIWSGQSELKEPGSRPAENVGPATSAIEFKDWKRHLQHSLDNSEIISVDNMF